MQNSFINTLLESKKVSIISHVFPDPDAISSALSVYGIINENFKNIELFINIETKISDNYKFLQNCNKISNLDTLSFLEQTNPDIIIITDANNFRNTTLQDAEKIRTLVKLKNTKIAIFDHHPDQFKEESKFYFNSFASSASEEVYNFFITEQNLKKYKGLEETIMFGILADTNRFMYKNNNIKRTFSIVLDLLEQGVIIEELQNKINRISKVQSLVIAELLKNLVETDTYNYSFISDEYAKNFNKQIGNWDDFSDAFYIFIDQYLKTVGKPKWGFAIIPDFSNDKSEYRGASRAINDIVDTNIWARAMGGGGHKSASGFSIKANNFEQALKKIKTIIQ